MKNYNINNATVKMKQENNPWAKKKVENRAPIPVLVKLKEHTYQKKKHNKVKYLLN